MRLLDLFCGAGGAGMGYHRAGFDIVGVDIKPQKNYPFEFHCADAFAFLEMHGHEFDVIHTSPPCQAYSHANRLHPGSAAMHPDLVGRVRDKLKELGVPFVIENVIGAPLENPIMLCGSFFGLKIIRHRNFETSFSVTVPFSCNHKNMYDPWHGKTGERSADKFRKAMDIDWMSDAGGGKRSGTLAQAIPPAYTAWIGEHLWKELKRKKPVPCTQSKGETDGPHSETELVS